MSMAAEIEYAKWLAPFTPSKFCYEVMASTRVIHNGEWRGASRTLYATELVTVDPVAKMDSGCQVVFLFGGGSPYLGTYTRKGVRKKGAFIVSGFVCSPDTIGKDIFILGRVVGPDRSRRAA